MEKLNYLQTSPGFDDPEQPIIDIEIKNTSKYFIIVDLVHKN